MEGSVDKNKSKNNKLLVVLVSIMIIVTLSVLGVLGVILYKGYASENVDSGVTPLDAPRSSNSNSTYYDNVAEYIDTYVAYVEKVYPVVLKGNMTDIYKEDVLYRTNEFILYSQSFDARPISNEDKLLDENFFNFKLSAENFADYTKSYVYKDEKVYLDLLKDNIKDSQIHADTISQLEKKYYK